MLARGSASVEELHKVLQEAHVQVQAAAFPAVFLSRCHLSFDMWMESGKRILAARGYAEAFAMWIQLFKAVPAVHRQGL